MYFAKQIKNLREKNKLSVQEVSSLLHFSYDDLLALENGEREPSISELKALALLYNVSTDKLIDTKGKKEKKSREVYKITKRTLVGFNRYGMKQGVSIITVPIVAFIGLCLMFVPGFAVQNQTVSLMKLMFLTNNFVYTLMGSLMFLIFGFIIIYWSVELTLGNYYRAKMKVLNNIALTAGSAASFAISLMAVLIFHHNILVGGIITYITLFLNALTQVIFLITMNLEGGDFSREHIYIYHESNYSGYDNKQWFTLGLAALSLTSFCMMFTIVRAGRPNILQEIKATMFDVFFKSDLLGVFIGGLCFAILIFNVVYWILVCTLPKSARRKMSRANNLLLVILNIVLFIVNVATMSYYGFEYITDAGIALFVLLFLTAIYGLCIVPVINCTKKTMYIEDETGLHKVSRIQGQKPGKIMAYKFSAIPQYVMLALLIVLTGIAFVSPKINFLAFFGIPAFILEIIFLCFQRNGKYVNIAVFSYGIIVNTLIWLFNIFLLFFSLFGKLGTKAMVAVTIVSASIIIVYACILFFLKPIRNASSDLE